MAFSRDLLYKRHRLSHQQIDDWLDNSEADNYLDDKLNNMSKILEFIAITDQLKSKNLDFISLKGPILSQRLYGDPTYRRYRDFDILLSQKDAEQAYYILIEMGYLPFLFELPKTDTEKKEFFKHIRDIPLYSSKTNFVIEIHTKLFKFNHIPQNQIESIIQSNLTSTSLSGRNFKVFNAELELLYLIMHGGLHRFRRLKWLVDIKDFIHNIQINKHKFQMLTQQLKAQRLVGLTNELLKFYFPESTFLKGGQQPHPKLLSKVIHIINDKELDENTTTLKKFIDYIQFRLFIIPGWRYKFSMLYNMLYFSYKVKTKHKRKSSFLRHLIKAPFQTLMRGLPHK